MFSLVLNIVFISVFFIVTKAKTSRLTYLFIYGGKMRFSLDTKYLLCQNSFRETNKRKVEVNVNKKYANKHSMQRSAAATDVD